MQKLLVLLAASVGFVACVADSSNRLDELYGEVEVVDTSGDGGFRPGMDTGDDVADGSEDTGSGGEFLDPCTSDGDCLAGYCVPYEGERVCTQFCLDGVCPGGFECRFLSGGGADTVRLCVPPRDTLCSPCTTDLDCGGFGDLCVRIGESGYCARDCEVERECPDGFLCDPATSLEGASGRQCMPATGRCTCPADAAGESRACIRANELGICEGVEVCQLEFGWSQCSAPIPVEEVCDGIDNDCDNQVDEGMTARPCTSIPNEIGSCEGTERCTGSGGWVCDAPTASTELCDELDNDCNGIIDDGLCFDGNPCTRDMCDPMTGGCNYPPFSGPCDDGNLCTTGEVCTDGACVGSPRDCNDGNQCTADACNATTGCLNTPAEGAPCETGNFCTNDFCSGGVCSPGAAVNCGTASVCLAPSCDPAVGCTTERLSGNRCDDDACTTGDQCSNGSCVEGAPACVGRPCSNCSGTWSIGGTCLDIFDSPQCICLCF